MAEKIGVGGFRRFCTMRIGRRALLACGGIFAIAQLAACSWEMSVGHGQPDTGGVGGSAVLLDEPARGGSGSALSNGGNGGLEAAGAGGQAGAPAPSCTGSLEAVNQALGPACPASFCEANAWAAASCSLPSGVLAASRQSCPGMQTASFDLGDGMTKTCV